MKIGIAADEISFDFETSVSLALEWGIRCFELKRLGRRRVPDVEEEDVAVVERVVEETGVTLTSLAPGLFKARLTSDVVEREFERLERTFALAHRLGISRIVVFGFEGDSRNEPMIDRVREVFSRAAARALEESVVLLLENEAGFVVDGPGAAARVVEDVDSPALRVNWDPCNALGCADGPPFPDGYRLVRDRVSHVHMKDARRRADGSVEYVVLGNGDVDWAGQLQALIADDYAGYCVLEPHFGNRVASSRAAAKAVNELISQARRGATAR